MHKCVLIVGLALVLMVGATWALIFDGHPQELHENMRAFHDSLWHQFHSGK